MNNQNWQLTQIEMREEAMTNADMEAQELQRKQEEAVESEADTVADSEEEEEVVQGGDHWTADVNERARVLAELRTMAYLADVMTSLDNNLPIQHDNQFLAVYETWGKDSRDYETPQDMIKAWDDYLASAPPAIRPVNEVETISASLTLNVGGASVSFSIQRDFYISSPRERLAVTESLQETIMKQHENWMRRNQSKLPGKPAYNSGKAAKNDGGNGAVDGEVPTNGEYAFTVQKVVTELVNEEKQYKVFGGEFTKWGVSMYPDSVTLEGFALNDFGPGEHRPPAVAHVYMRNGSPKRVLRLVRK